MANDPRSDRASDAVAPTGVSALPRRARATPWGLTRRGFVLVLAAATASGCAPGRELAPPSAHSAERPSPTPATAPTAGMLLLAQAGGFTLVDLATLRETPLGHLPKDAYIAAPALSPDRSRVAYTYYVLPKDRTDLGGADLYVMEVSGANARLVRPHPEPGASFEEPCWTSDGSALLATLRSPIFQNGQFRGESVAIVRVDLAGGEPHRVVANAQSGATSPDGRRLAYVSLDPRGQPTTLRVADIDGSGSTSVVDGQGFTLIRTPRFSPDGSRLVFAAVGGPGVNPSSAPSVSSPRWFAVAEAHGVPWELWSVRLDGSDLLRLTHEGEDSPVPAWSPDGAWIAFTGEMGLYVVDSAGRQTVRVSSTIGSGGLTWLR